MARREKAPQEETRAFWGFIGRVAVGLALALAWLAAVGALNWRLVLLYATILILLAATIWLALRLARRQPGGTAATYRLKLVGVNVAFAGVWFALILFWVLTEGRASLPGLAAGAASALLAGVALTLARISRRN